MKNIEDLRQHIINTLYKLEHGEIDLEEASITSKLCENIISTLKCELAHKALLKDHTPIKYIGDYDATGIVDISRRQIRNS